MIKPCMTLVMWTTICFITVPAISQTQADRAAAHSGVNITTYGECSPAFVNISGDVNYYCGTDAEAVYWQSIANSNKISDIESYIVRYQNGRFLQLAEERLALLRRRHSTAFDYLRRGWSHIESFGAGGSLDWVSEQSRRALENFERAAEVYPELAQAQFARGWIYYMGPSGQDYSKALNAFNRAIEIDPNFSESYLFRGYSYTSMQESRLACEDYLRFQATNNYLREERFRRYLEQGRFTREFLEYHGCGIPANFSVARPAPTVRQVDCNTTLYSGEIESCAAQGNPRAMAHLADSVWRDAWNRQNVELAQRSIDYWRRLIHLDDPRGFLGMSKALIVGLGVEKNCQAAYQYLQRASEAQLPDALFNLGHMYLRSECVNRSIQNARRLFARSAVLGNVHAQSMIENIDSCSSNPRHWLQPCRD